MVKKRKPLGEERFWINGRFVGDDGATISLLDRGVLFGDALYEVVRFYRRRLFLLDGHLDRLFEEAATIGLPAPCGREEIGRAIEGLAARGEEEDGLVLLHWTRGEGPRRLAPPPGLRGNLFAIRLPLPALPRRARREGVSVVTLPDRRWPGADIKSVNLLANVLARKVAEEQGAHEALLYRGKGDRARLTEGTSSSFFFVLGGVLVTPAVRGLLPGITRDAVLRVARESEIPFEERTVRLGELPSAWEVFLTATSAEILPVRSIDGRTPASATPGPLTIRLIEGFRRYRRRILRAVPPARP
ncbi:MAG: aminotransferase class IV [Candidatus Eisenbacteria bacterium]